MISLLNQNIRYFTFIEKDYKGLKSYSTPTNHKARIVAKNISSSQQRVGNLVEKVFTTTCTIKKTNCQTNDKIEYNGLTYYVTDVQEWIDGRGRVFGNYIILRKENV